MGYFGSILLRQLGAFLRWLLYSNGAKMSFKNYTDKSHQGFIAWILNASIKDFNKFFEEHSSYFGDMVLGAVAFFAVLLFLVNVLHIDKW